MAKQISEYQHKLAAFVVQTAAPARVAERRAWRAANQNVDINQQSLGPLVKPFHVPEVAESEVVLNHCGRERCDFRDPDTRPAELLPSQVNGTDSVTDAQVTKPRTELVLNHSAPRSFRGPALRAANSASGFDRSSRSGPTAAVRSS